MHAFRVKDGLSASFFSCHVLVNCMTVNEYFLGQNGHFCTISAFTEENILGEVHSTHSNDEKGLLFFNANLQGVCPLHWTR